MLIPFTPAQQRTVYRLRTEYQRALSLIAESMGLTEVLDVHSECIGFIVPDPPGIAVPNPTPETISAAPQKE